MLLKDAEFYPALIWAIKKYTKSKLPDTTTEIHDEETTYIRIDGVQSLFARPNTCICNMVTWSDTPDGHDYWIELNALFILNYNLRSKEDQMFKLMMEDYNKRNPQLEFDFKGDK